MQNIQLIFAALIAVGFAYLLIKKARAAKQKSDSNASSVLFRDVLALLADPQIEAGKTIGSWTLTGRYQNQFFQIQTIVDILATRKLPSLWLMITLPEAQPVAAIFDLMMRPSGPTTFSNFDFLNTTVPTPARFPTHAVIRTDDPASVIAPKKVLPFLEIFHGGRGKELLISPKGLRIVVQAAEADRARYSVMREADFGAHCIDADLAKQCMQTLLELQTSLKESDA